MKKRDKSFKRVSLCVPFVVMMLTPVPLSGFIGLEQPELPELFAAKASAAQEYPSENIQYWQSRCKNLPNSTKNSKVQSHKPTRPRV
ncbi:MAG: hypothetical protein PUF31_10700 [Oscillospiraceae bacterium]|nr:hypothetical protein [Oscillospiraceae bacterium]